VAAEPWALRLAGKIEAIRERVVAAIGQRPTSVVDIVVRDPVAEANGLSLSLLDTPRMELWTTPPKPVDSLTDGFWDWAEAVALHEDVHLVHMVRRPRSPLEKLVGHLLGFGPIKRKSPRWLREGYATMLEGQLTGQGRPNGDFRAALLRRWALAGRLPSYGQMNGGGQAFLAGHLPYFVGSAYLEWLVERQGPDSPPALWARLTARSRRDFSEAFKGVYRDTPERLYGRFSAELTWRAMEVERRVGNGKQEGVLWQDLTWGTGEPQVSPDGTKLAAILRQERGRSRIVVWSTASDTDAEKTLQQRIERLRRKDPEDIAPVPAGPPPRKKLHELVMHNGVEPTSLRWFADGRGLLSVSAEPDSEGFLHQDLFRWSLSDDRVERLTRGAGVLDADVAPDGTWAAAVRNRWGASALVRVELATGVVTELCAASLDDVYGSPRFAPDGRRLAFVRHRDGAWHLVVRELVSGRERLLESAENAAQPAWSPDGRFLYVARGDRGLIDIYRVAADGEASAEAVTRSTGALLAPAPTPDGKGLYFLSLEHDGYDIRYLDLGVERTVAATSPLSLDLAPALKPATPEPHPELAVAPIGPVSAYGVGRLELRPLLGGSRSPAGASVEAALRAGDLLGRSELIIVGGRASQGGIGGVSLAGTWRGWPVTLSMQAFSVSQRPSEQDRAPAALGQDLDADRLGFTLNGEWKYLWRTATLTSSAGVLWNRVDPVGEAPFNQKLAFVGANLDRRPSRGAWRWPHRVELQWQTGRSGNGSWRGFSGKLEAGIFFGGKGLGVAWERRTVRGAPSPFDRIVVGGVASSLLPDVAASNRVLVSALPVGTLLGDDYECQRAELRVFGVPLFYARHRAWDRGVARGPWLRVAGLAVDVSGPPAAAFKLPGLRMSLGVARVLDEPLKGRTVWWLGLAYRP
jgi:hypothetical protein